MFTPRNIKGFLNTTKLLSVNNKNATTNATTIIGGVGSSSSSCLRSFANNNNNQNNNNNNNNTHEDFHHEKKNNHHRTIAIALGLGGLLSSIAAYYLVRNSNISRNNDNLQSLLAQALSAQEHHSTNKEEQERTNDNVNALLQHNTPIYRVVLTGGPCAGKSSAMTKLRERLQNLGFQVFIIPEAATLLMTGGAKVTANSSVEDVLAFESSLIKTQMAIEDNFQEIARVSKKPTILLCDRGTMDPKAYTTDDLWQVLMDMNGWSIPMLRDKRYDCVIHLVTTAIGAEKFYTLENNTVRTETIDQARELDHRLRASYIGHSQLYIVDNAVNSFDEKLQKVYNILSHQIGIPRAKSSRRRFLLKSMDRINMDLRHEVIDLEQIFIPTGNEKDITRIVKRGQNGVCTYSYHSTQTIEDGLEKIEARPISARTYVNLSSQADKNRIPILKKIYSFVYMNHYFELNHYLNGKGKGTTILTVEAVAGQEVSIPPFLEPYILEEVTNNNKLSSHAYALKN